MTDLAIQVVPGWRWGEKENGDREAQPSHPRFCSPSSGGFPAPWVRCGQTLPFLPVCPVPTHPGQNFTQPHEKLSWQPGPRPEAGPEPASGCPKELTGTHVGCAAAHGRACPGAGPRLASQGPGAQPHSAGCSGSGSQSQHHPGSEGPGRGWSSAPALAPGTPVVSVRRKGCSEPYPLPPDQPRASVPPLPPSHTLPPTPATPAA